MMAASDKISSREFLVFYYRYRTRLMMAFILPFAAIIALSFVPVPRYEASSVLIVRLGSEYVYQPEIPANRNGPEAVLPFDRDQIFKSEVAILESDDLHAQVIKDIGLDRLYPEMIAPHFYTPLLRAINQTLGSLGLADDMTPEQQQKKLYARALARFDKRLDIKLEKESAVINISFQHKDAAMSAAALDTLLKLYMEKRKQLYQEPRLTLAQEQLNILHDKATTAEQAVETFKHKHKIYSLADQRAELLQERSDIDKKRATISNPALDEKLSFFNRQLDDLDAQERELDRLQHEKQIAEDEYALSSHKLNEAAAFEELERERAGSVRIIQPPTASAEPKRWQWLIILLGFFTSVLSVLGIAAITELSEDGFLTPEKMERKLGLPVLAVLSLRKSL